MGIDHSGDPEQLAARMAEVLAERDAPAAGYWALDAVAGRLVQVAFVPGPGLDAEVGRAFAAATRSVPLDQTGLGIVAAALSGRPVVSVAAELPAEAGSGRWLRLFGAERSIAVPVPGEDGTIRGVVSIALRTGGTGIDEAVIRSLRDAAG